MGRLSRYFSIPTLLSGFFAFLLALACLLWAWAPHLLTPHTLPQRLFISLLFIFFGWLGWYFVQSVYRLRKGLDIRFVSMQVHATPESIEQGLSLFLREHFNSFTRVEVLSIKKELHVFLDLPFFPEEEQKPVVDRLEKSLQSFLREQFGMTENFLLVTSFQEKA